MIATERVRSPIIRLTQAAGNVVVEPEDEDRFVVSAQQAMKACQDSHRQELAVYAFKKEFLEPLIDWCRRHKNQVQACYIPIPKGFIQVFVIGSSPKYDFDLGKELSELELRFADAGWSVSFLQIPASPEEILLGYFKMEGAIEVYAQLAAAPGQGES
jgi:hypothetical protein